MPTATTPATSSSSIPPREALDLVHALVPNIELNNFISVSRTRQFLAYTYRLNASLPTNTARTPLAQWTLSHWCLHYWLARYCADHKIALTPAALGERAPLQISGIDPALPPDLTPLRWQAFLDDYFHLVDFSYMNIDSESERERRRQTVLRCHDITLPNDIEEDWHAKHCRLCMRGLANFAHHFDGFNDYPPFRAFLKAQPKKSSYQRLPEATHIGTYVMDAPLPSGGLGVVESFASRLRLVRAHTAPFSDEAVERSSARKSTPKRLHAMQHGHGSSGMPASQRSTVSSRTSGAPTTASNSTPPISNSPTAR